MTRKGPLAVLAVLLVMVAAVVGLSLVDRPGLIVPLVLEAAVFAGITRFFLSHEEDNAQRKWLAAVVAVGGVARVFMIGLVYGVLNPYLFAPDTASYEYQGEALVSFWAGLAPAPVIAASWQKGYALLNAGAITMLGEPTWFMVVLNVFAALWTVLLTYFITRRCFGIRAARFAAVLTAVFPSMILWSVLNIRDAITMAVVTMLVLMAIRAYGRLRLRDLVWFGLGLLALSTLRDYMGFLVIAGIALGYFGALRPGRVVSTFVVGIAASLVVIMVLERAGIFSPDVLTNPVSDVQRMRLGLQQDFVQGTAGSAFGTDVEINSVGDMARYLPVGLTFFLFAPFPWSITSILQLTTLPEVLLWYLLVPFVVMGLRDAGRKESAATLLPIGVLVLTVCTYALVEGNFGTAYRHRAQVMPLFFVLAGQGLARWWDTRVQARRAALRKRADARVALLRAGGRR